MSPKEPDRPSELFLTVSVAPPVSHRTTTPGDNPADVQTGPYEPGPAPLSAAPLEAGRYRIDAEIGHGGMGVVYRSHDPEFDRTLAVKVLLERHQSDADLERRFLEEARITAQLQHPGIAPVHAIGRLPDGRPYFSMKLIDGRTLAAMLRKRADPAQDLPRFLTIFSQVCQTLAYAHSRGVIHRDIKPANVMVGAFGEVQVMDWGLAKLVGQASSPVRDSRTGEDACPTPTAFTQAGAVIGTFAYMPPEQARAEQTDERADVFSLGALLCEILTGRPPYIASDASDLWRKAKHAELDDANALLDRSGSDEELIALTKRCLAVEPAQRPRHAGETADAVTAYLAAVEERARQAEKERAAAEARAVEERKRRRVTLGLAAAVLLLVVGGGIGAILLHQQHVKEGEADAKAQDSLAQAHKEYAEGWEANDLAKLDAAQVAAVHAAEVAVDADLRRQAEEMKDEIVGRHRVATRNRQLRDALVDIALPRETHKYEKTDTGQMTALVELTVEEQFAAAFHRWGIDVDGSSAEEIVSRLEVQPQPIVQDVVAGLDEWALDRRRNDRPEADWRKLIEVAERLDRNDRRKKLRQLLANSPVKPSLATIAQWMTARAELLRLAKQVDIKKEPVLGILSLARVLEKFGESRQAETLLKAAVAVHRNEVILLDGLGKLLERDRPPRHAQAIEYYRTACGIRPQLGVALARALGESGRTTEAEAILRDLAASTPDNPEFQLYFALVLFVQNKLGEAETACRQAIALRPAFPAAFNNLANALAKQDRLPEAEAALRQAIALRANFPEPYNNLAVQLVDQKKPAEAEALCRQAIALRPGYAKAYNNLGNALYHQRKLSEAEAAYRTALSLEADDTFTYLNLGNVLAELNRPAEAEAIFRKVIALHPDDHLAHHNLGLALHDQKKLVDAEAACRKAIALRPEYPLPYNSLGVVLVDQKRPAEAEAAFRKAIALKDDYPEPYGGLGIVLRQQKKFDQAEVACRKFVALRPDDHKGYDQLGVVLAEQNKLAEAEAAYRKAIALWRDDHLTFHNLGLSLAEQKRSEEAEAAFRKAKSLREEFAKVYYNLGGVLLDHNKHREAEAAYRKAIALRSDYAQAHNNLGNALFRQNKLAEAETFYRQAIALRPHYPLAFHNLGTALRNQKKLAEAVEAFRTADQQSPNHPDIKGNLEQTELWVKIDHDFSAVLAGKLKLGSRDQLDFAVFCTAYKQHYHTGARYFVEAFASDPLLAMNPVFGRRIWAARSAALAAADKGNDAANLDDKERTRLRKQALDWLTADLAAWAAVVDKGSPEERKKVPETLAHWQTDPDLATLRDKDALAKLPEAERQAFEKLWADVDALLQKAKKLK